MIACALWTSGCDTQPRPGANTTPDPPASTTPRPPSAPAPDPSLGRISPDTASRLLALEIHESDVDRTVWASEMHAARCGAVFDALWDRLNASTSCWEVLRRFDGGTWMLPDWEPPRPEVHGIVVHAPRPPAVPPSPADRNALTERLARAGWSLQQCEFRHVRFDTPSAGLPARSRFAFAAHLVRPEPEERAVLEGPLDVAWLEESDAAGRPRIGSIDARGLELRTRLGPPPFRTLLSEPVTPGRLSPSIDPLIAHDLDQDGSPEILLIARNLLFRRPSDGGFRSEPISPALASVVYAAVLGRFDDDPYPDLLCQTLRSLELLPGQPDGRFASAFRRAWTAPDDV